MTKSDRVLLFACAAMAGLLPGTAAEAGGFAIREQSARGQGTSFAGMAAGGSVSSMFWNPATLSDVGLIEVEAVITGVLPFVDVEYEAPSIAVPLTDAGDIGNDAVVPAGYAAMRLGPKLVFGVGMNGPFGLSTEYDASEPIRTLGVAGQSKVFSLNLNPAVSYQLTDWLALAVGAQLQYLTLDYTDLGLPPPLGSSDVDGNDVAFGFTAGVTIKPFAGTEIGIGYRSFIDHEIEGDFDSGGLDVTFESTVADFDLPDIVSVGLRQTIHDRVRVMAGVEWANWSRFDTLELAIPGTTIPLNFDYDDGWFFSVGGEFDVRPNLTLRAGIGYELSPIDDDTRSFRLPDNDRLWLSAGASYEMNGRLSFDAGYSFIMAEDTDILSAAEGGPAGNGPFSGSADTNIHIVSVGTKLKLGGAPHASK